MLTADQSIQYQQNLRNRKISLVVFGSNDWSLLRNHTPEIVAAVDCSTSNSFTSVEIPLRPKREYKTPEKPSF